jgi:cytoskeletal protein CcmA (bactofilin family)
MLLAFGLSTVPGVSQAAQEQHSFGGDVYSSGTDASVSNDAPRDVFAAGFSTTVTGAVNGDLHLAGFSVNSNGRVGQDFYAAGSSISVSGAVDRDATIAGFTVNLGKGASVGGNARIAAGTLKLKAPVAGSAIITAGDVEFDAPVNGDVQLTAGNIVFGPQARVIGSLSYSAPERVTIPESVVTPDRVRYTQISADSFSDVSDTIAEAVPSPWPAFVGMITGFLIMLIFFVLVGALALSFAPGTVARLKGFVQLHPGKMLLLGFVGLSTLFGMVVVSLLTLVAIPLIPFVILACFVVWVLGYLLGAYALAMKVASAFELNVQSIGGKLLTLAIAVTLLSVLNFIPIGGWILNLAIVLLGIGAMTAVLMKKVNWGALEASAGKGGEAPNAG